MPRPGIPPALEAAVLEQAGKGRSNRDIAAWLKSEHKVTVAHVTVGKLLTRVRQEVGESTRAVAVSEIAPKVREHVVRLAAVADRAKAIEEEAMRGELVLVDGVPLLDSKKDPIRVPNRAQALKALELQRRTHVDALRVAGADAGDPGATDSKGTLLDKMRRLAGG